MVVLARELDGHIAPTFNKKGISNIAQSHRSCKCNKAHTPKVFLESNFDNCHLSM
jgi:hypothetical protein